MMAAVGLTLLAKTKEIDERTSDAAKWCSDRKAERTRLGQNPPLLNRSSIREHRQRILGA